MLETPYVEEDPLNKNPRFGFTGVAINYLQRLVDRIGMMEVKLEKWNGTFSGFIDHMATCGQENCTCDIGVGAFVRSTFVSVLNLKNLICS